MTRTVLITGATGFVGRKLVSEMENLKKWNLRLAVRNQKKVESHQIFAIDNLDGHTCWEGAFTDCEVVVHLAGRAHQLKDSAKDPYQAFMVVNAEGTLNLARQASDAGVKRFIYISSIAVHGVETTEKALTEKDVLNPVTPYGISKMKAEEGLRDLAHKTEMEVVVIRPPLVYAEDAPGNFKRLLSLVDKNLPLPFGRVFNKRSLVSRENLVSFIVHCLDNPLARNETFLIADGEDVSTPEMMQLLSQGMGKKVRMLPVPSALLKWGSQLLGKEAIYQQLCGNLQLDSSKARDYLKWVPVGKVKSSLVSVGKRYKNG